MLQNLGKVFKEAGAKHRDEIAIQYMQDETWQTLSYGIFSGKVKGLSLFLLQEQVAKGDRVGILLENRPEWPIVFFAAVSIGAVVVPANCESSQKEIENILKDSECKIIFVNNNLFTAIERRKVISVDSIEFKKAIEMGGETKDIHVDRDDLACILYTSGTTSSPKGVMLTHGNLISNCQALYGLNIISEKDSTLSVLPLHHIYPLTITMLIPFLCGGKVIYPGSIRPETIAKAMQDTNPTLFVAVPRIYYSFYQKITDEFKKIPFLFKILFNFVIELLYVIRNKTGANLARYLLHSIHKKFGKSLRIFISGGAKLDIEVAKTFFKLGFTILEGYGLTETSPVLTLNTLSNFKIGCSVGRALPGVELRVINKDMEGIGEVIAAGSNIMKGYYKRDDLTKEVIKDGWFHTGDLGYIDKQGYLYLTGRVKEVVVLSSGKNVYPEEIERVYSKAAPIKEMCVFDKPIKKEKGEVLTLWALVVPDFEGFTKIDAVNLRQVIKERFDNVSRTLPSYMRLMGFTITLEKLPRTLLGKIQRFSVKEKYLSSILYKEEKTQGLDMEKMREEDKKILHGEIAAKIINCLREETGIKRKLIPKDLLELDLGIDSLGRIELASSLEQAFKMRLSDEIIGKVFTVGDLISAVEALIKEKTGLESFQETGISFGPAYWKTTLEMLPRKENLEKIDLKPNFIAWIVIFILTAIPYIIFKMFYNLKIKGRENVLRNESYILYANHSSYFDAFLIGASLPNFSKLDMFFVGYRVYFDVPVIRRLIKIARLIPLGFSSHFLEALRSSFYVLKNGKNLCLFPEGMRTIDGKIGEFKKGFGILAKEANVKLLPVLLTGAHEAWPRTSKYPKHFPITVRFGKAIDAEEAEEIGYNLGAKDSYEAVCLGAREVLIKLKEEKYN